MEDLTWNIKRSSFTDSESLEGPGHTPSSSSTQDLVSKVQVAESQAAGSEAAENTSISWQAFSAIAAYKQQSSSEQTEEMEGHGGVCSSDKLKEDEVESMVRQIEQEEAKERKEEVEKRAEQEEEKEEQQEEESYQAEQKGKGGSKKEEMKEDSEGEEEEQEEDADEEEMEQDYSEEEADEEVEEQAERGADVVDGEKEGLDEWEEQATGDWEEECTDEWEQVDEGEEGIQLQGRRDAASCAVTLQFLKDFYKNKVQPREKGGSLMTTADVVKSIIAQETASDEVRYVDMPGVAKKQEVGLLDYFISHNWSNPFSLLVEQVSKHLESALETQAKVWLDIFAMSQHEPEHQEEDLAVLQRAIKASKATLLVVDEKGEVFKWLPCLYEMGITLELKGSDSLKMLSQDLPHDKLAAMIASIDIKEAGYREVKGRDHIFASIIASHGSLATFNSQLKLQLLLKPLSFKLDLADELGTVEASGRLLDLRAVWDSLDLKGTQTQGLSRVHMTLIVDDSDPGKSAIFALLHQKLKPLVTFGTTENEHGVGSASREAQVLAACHLFKRSDVRHQDLCKIIRSLAYQLAVQSPALVDYYCSLLSDSVILSATPEVLFKQLLVTPLNSHLSRTAAVVIMLGALDEARAPYSSRHLIMHPVCKLLNMMKALPANVRLLCTTRAEPANLLHAISTLFPDRRQLFSGNLLDTAQLEEEVIQQLCAACSCDANIASHWLSRISRADRSFMCHLTLLQTYLKSPHFRGGLEAGADPESTISQLPTTVDEVYGLIMNSALGTNARYVLLDVLSVAQEPLSLLDLQEMGFEDEVCQLPEELFLRRDGHLHLLHKSLHEQLLSDQHRHAAHLFLGRFLAKNSSKSNYALKYAVFHLTSTPSSEATELLEQLLTNFQFITDAYQTGLGASLINALSTARFLSRASDDWLLCLRSIDDLLRKDPSKVVDGLLTCPIETRAYKAAENHLCSQPGIPSRGCRTLFAMDWYSWAPHLITIQANDAKLAYSPDSSLLLTGDSDHEVQLWDAATGQLLVKLGEHSGPVTAVAYCPDNRTLASGSYGGEVKIWDMWTGQVTTTLKNERMIESLAFSPNGGQLAIGCDDGSLVLWDLASTRVAVLLELGIQNAHQRAYAPWSTGTLRTSTLAGNQVKFTVWRHKSLLEEGCDPEQRDPELQDLQDPDLQDPDLQDPELQDPELRDPDQQDPERRDPELRDPDLQDPELQDPGLRDPDQQDPERRDPELWDPDLQDPERRDPDVVVGDRWTSGLIPRRAPQYARAYSIAFSPDGLYLASGSDTNMIILWDVTSGQILTTWHAGGSVDSLAFSRDGSLLVTGCSSGFTHIWDLSTSKSLMGIDAHLHGVNCVALSPDGALLASTGEDYIMKLWNLATGKLQLTLSGVTGNVVFSPDGRHLVNYGDNIRIWDATVKLLEEPVDHHSKEVTSIAYCPQGNQFATGSADGKARLWSRATGELLHATAAHTPVHKVTFSPDGRKLAVVHDYDVQLWDIGLVTEPRERTSLPHTYPDEPLDVAFSLDSKVLVCGSAFKPICLWYLEDIKIKAKWDECSKGAYSVAFNPNGTILASGHDDSSVKLWKVETGQMIRKLEGHCDTVLRVTFSSDGRLLASGGGSEDGTIMLWKMSTMEWETTIDGFRGGHCIAFSPNTRLLASGASGNTIKLRDSKTLQVVAILAGHRGSISSIAFSPDGECLVSGSSDMTARVWDLTPLQVHSLA